VVSGPLVKWNPTSGQGRVNTDMNKRVSCHTATPEWLQDLSIGRPVSIRLTAEGEITNATAVAPADLAPER